MFKKYKIILSIVMCSAIILSFGSFAKVYDGIVIEKKSYIPEQGNYKDVSETYKSESVQKLKHETISDSKIKKNDLLDESGELKETVIVEDEEEYCDNNNRMIIEYRSGGSEPDEILKHAEKEKDIDNKIKVYKIKSSKYIKKVVEIAQKYSSDIQIAQPDYVVKAASKRIQEESTEKDYYKSGEQWALGNDGTFEGPEDSVEDADIKAV